MGNLENLRGSLLMVAAMAGFAVEDMIIMFIAQTLPVGQILVLMGAGGALVFTIQAACQRKRLWTRALLAPAVIVRNTAELVGTIGFVTAIALTPLSSASAILQAAPLVVVMGAALFLGEKVGWRRWTAVGAGFCGVLMIVRPGLAGFEPNSLFAVVGVFGLAARDLATRWVPAGVASVQLAGSAFASLVPAGLLVLAVSGTPLVTPEPQTLALFALALGFAVLAYSGIVAATRIGDISVIAPFRYSRIVFALILGIAVFGERPDAMTLIGSAVIVASGTYAFVREARLRARARASLRASSTV